jgi:LysR family transcriptional regulator, transcriptional activator of nhaA
MEWLNYHHLLYFWSVAKHGTVGKACKELRLTQPTISAQIRVLEDTLGEKLFLRSGRYLVLTEMGRVAFKYAEDIFSLGQDLMSTLKSRGVGRPMRLVVGIADAVPKQFRVQVVAGHPNRVLGGQAGPTSGRPVNPQAGSHHRRHHGASKHEGTCL